MSRMDENTIGVERVTDWLQEVARNDSISAIARRIGTPQRTLANHVKSGDLDAREVIAVSRAYDYSPILSLEQLGFITAAEVEAYAREISASEAPIEELIGAAMARIEVVAHALKVVAVDAASREDMEMLKFVISDALREWTGEKIDLNSAPSAMFDEPVHLNVTPTHLDDLAALRPGYDYRREAEESGDLP